MTHKRVAIKYIDGAYLRDYEKSYIPMFGRELRENGSDFGLSLEPDPSKADFIILWEGFEYKTPTYIKLLEGDPIIRNFAERVYSINYDDHPEGFLAGAYTSLESPYYNPETHRIWPFFLMNNPRVYDLRPEDIFSSAPRRLFSFTGAASHLIRRRLFELYSGTSQTHHVEHVKKWYNHGDDDRLKFARVALDSAFCLCPHGYCSYTPRITEIMAMGRAPVIIADDWIPFSFDDGSPYYIKIPERDVEHIPDILSSRLSEAQEIGRNARRLWERYCSPKRRASAVVDCIANLSERPGPRPSYANYRDQWNSREFLSKLGWTSHQLTALRIEQHVRRYLPNVKIPGVSELMRYRNAPNLR